MCFYERRFIEDYSSIVSHVIQVWLRPDNKLTKPVLLIFMLPPLLSLGCCLFLQVYVCSDEEPCSREYQYHRYPRHPVRGETEDKPRSATPLGMVLSVFLSFSYMKSSLLHNIHICCHIYCDLLSLAFPASMKHFIGMFSKFPKLAVYYTFSLHSSSAPCVWEISCSITPSNPPCYIQ